MINLNLAVVGTAGVGKTLFCINFAEYMGAASLSYSEVGREGEGRALLSPAGARRLMVGRGRRGSGVVRTFTVHLPLRPYRRLALIDTAALPEREPLPRFERPRLALTLEALARANLILLLIDLSCADPVREEFNERAAGYLADYCGQQGKLFFTGGSKADLLKGAAPGRGRCLLYTGAGLLPISSLSGLGFARVKERLRRAALAAEGSPCQVIN